MTERNSGSGSFLGKDFRSLERLRKSAVKRTHYPNSWPIVRGYHDVTQLARIGCSANKVLSESKY
jgi:hypothetical protein